MKWSIYTAYNASERSEIAFVYGHVETDIYVAIVSVWYRHKDTFMSNTSLGHSAVFSCCFLLSIETQFDAGDNFRISVAIFLLFLEKKNFHLH